MKLRETLCVLDLGKSPTLSVVLDMVKACADICHQSACNATLVKLPSRTKSMSMKSYLNNLRKIEDAILSNGMNLDATYTVLYDTSSFHGNDA